MLIDTDIPISRMFRSWEKYTELRIVQKDVTAAAILCNWNIFKWKRNILILKVV